MKARYPYRFYPTYQQRQSLAQLFGCVRVVWNDASVFCKQSEKLPSHNELQKMAIAQAKQTEPREWLSGVSNSPLQQSVADLGVTYNHFSNSLKGKRKGKTGGSPRFKKKTGRQSARFRIGGFSIQGREIYLTRIGSVKPIGSGELPATPFSVAVIKDAANRYFLSFVLEVEPVQVNAANHSIGIDLGIKTFAVMSDGSKAVSLKVQCLNCGTEHDRDENAAKTINKVGIGHCHDSKRTQTQSKSTSVASVCEALRITAPLGR